MPNIQVLAPHVADLIAAGEVVERPASVVKELLENAIDSGASAVTVEIAHGGMSLIRVTDDGCGIPADQAPTAFLRHATSKISTERDLEAIGTLGFRGEALAAISAVSRVELLTRTEGEALGTALAVEAGEVVGREEAGCPKGTAMTVRELFYNTPARLKFMKKDTAEGAAVFAAVQRTALSHPELSVKFIRDGKQELLTPGDGQLKSAVYAVMGRDIALGFLGVKGSGEGMAVEGFASLPACCRGSRGYQHFFVNGRYIKSRLMTAAVEEAYKNQKMVGKFPGCVIHLTVSPAQVDVNVHPTKTEVKFQREQAVFAAVYHAVLSALDRDHTRPQAAIPGVKPSDTVTPNQASLPLNDGAKTLAGTQFMPAARFKPLGGAEPAVRPQPSAPAKPAAAPPGGSSSPPPRPGRSRPPRRDPPARRGKKRRTPPSSGWSPCRRCGRSPRPGRKAHPRQKRSRNSPPQPQSGRRSPPGSPLRRKKAALCPSSPFRRRNLPPPRGRRPGWSGGSCSAPMWWWSRGTRRCSSTSTLPTSGPTSTGSRRRITSPWCRSCSPP